LLEISHNSTSIAKNCWKKFYWRYIEGLTPISKPVAFSLGSVIHDAFDLHYKGFPTNEVTEYINKTFDELIANVSPDEAENLVVAKYTALGMWMNYPTKDLNEFTDVQAEKSFEVLLSPGVMLVGRVDGLLTYKDRRWIRELKTTGMHFSQFERRSRISSQATTYVYAMNKLGEDVAGVIYDYIKKPLLRKNMKEDMHDFGRRIMRDYRERPGIYYRRHLVYRNPVELEQFEYDLKNVVKDIQRKKRYGGFYRSSDSCFNYNVECPYFKICHQDKPDPLTVKLYYNKKEAKECQTK
jgi:hypothetical protein